MPSLFATIYQAHAIPVLSEQLAEPSGVVQYPLGDMTSPRAITGIWCEEDAQDNPQRGHENLRKCFLTILDSTISVDPRDIFALASLWTDQAMVLTTPPPQPWIVRSVAYGAEPSTVVALERRDYEVRNGKGGKVL
jgi:hypothetical protein